MIILIDYVMIKQYDTFKVHAIHSLFLLKQ